MASTISIRAWHHEISVPRDHPSPARVRDHIEALTEVAAEALGAGLDSYVERKAGEVILIRELVFDCDIDTRCDRRQAAHALACRCAQDLVRSVEGGSSDVVRFASRGAFVARFVEDLANGSAWGQWYYASFDGVRAMPTAAAIRTVLVDAPAVGRAALGAVTPAGWSALGHALQDDEAARILEGLVADGGEAAASFIPAHWNGVLDIAPLGAIAAPVQVAALQLLALALRAGAAGSVMDVVAARLLGSVVVLARSAAFTTLDALLQGDVRALARDEPGLAGELAVHLAGPLGPVLRSLAARADKALRPERATAGSESPAQTAIDAPFAGLGLLLAEVDGLLLTEVSLALPRLEGVPVREAAALTIIAVAAGSGRARLVWHDPAWREFLGLPSALRWDAYVAALAAAVPDRAHRAQVALAKATRRHRRGEAIATALRAQGRRLHCEADGSNGLWLALRTDGPGPAVPDSSGLAPRLAMARRARADWRDLAGDAFADSLPLAWRAVFVAGAQIAWRRIAQRVPGMTGASIDYLRENLLGNGMTATRLDDGRWRWRLRRPPLYVLLSLTGIARGTEAWHGPPERRFEWDFSP